MYSIAFKIDKCIRFPHGLSGQVEVAFSTIDAALEEIRLIRDNPGSVNCIDELQTAIMWVVDDNGNFLAD